MAKAPLVVLFLQREEFVNVDDVAVGYIGDIVNIKILQAWIFPKEALMIVYCKYCLDVIIWENDVDRVIVLQPAGRMNNQDGGEIGIVGQG